MRNSKFVITKDKRGEYRFTLRAGNGAVLVEGDGGYPMKDSALNAIEAIRKVAKDATVVDLT